MKKLFFIIILNFFSLNSMQDKSFIQQFLDNPDVLLNPDSKFYLPTEIGNLIAKNAIENSSCFKWIVLKLCKTQKRTREYFEPEKTICHVAGTTFRLEIYNKKGRIIHKISDPKGFGHIIWDKKYDKFISVTNSSMRLWDANAGKLIKVLIENQPIDLEEIKFNNLGNKIIIVCKNKTAKVMDLETGCVIHNFKNEYPIHTAEFSNKGNKIVTTDSSSIARIWRTKTGKLLYSMNTTIDEFNDVQKYFYSLYEEDSLMSQDKSDRTLFWAKFSKDDKKLIINQNDFTICHHWIELEFDIRTIKYLENRMSLEQALLLYFIYETELINRRNKLLNKQIDKVLFDLTKYPNLKEIYNSFPKQIQEVLAKYIKEA